MRVGVWVVHSNFSAFFWVNIISMFCYIYYLLSINVTKKANGWLEVKFEDNHRILRLKFDNTAAISERFGRVNTVIINNVNNSNGDNVDVNVRQGKIIINE